MPTAIHQSQERGKARIRLEEFNRQYQPQLRCLIAAKGNFTEATIHHLQHRIQQALHELFSQADSQYLFVIWDTIHGITDSELHRMNTTATKNFGLNEVDFLRMVTALQQGDEELFERIFLAHFQDCQRFLQHKDQALPADAYDATMEALLEIRTGLIKGKIQYGNLRYLFTRIARQRYYRRHKPQSVEVSMPEDFDRPEVLPAIPETEYHLLSKCWDELDAESRALLKSVYYDRETLKDIAGRMDKSPAAMRKKKQRCLQKLKDLFLHHSR